MSAGILEEFVVIVDPPPPQPTTALRLMCTACQTSTGDLLEGSYVTNLALLIHVASEHRKVCANSQHPKAGQT